ncbi:hypothetical protein [Actinacidiphila oryziradicis]|uniref:hypothetical protein n=1 Tax=Actinacidiphila oryziradicis TaxID=2571141 RepID=UPI0023F47EEE|nr:hypothetical protein [Actinacidiphila oryziradicis]
MRHTLQLLPPPMEWQAAAGVVAAIGALAVAGLVWVRLVAVPSPGSSMVAVPKSVRTT